MAMNTDVAVLAKEAGNFERISGELKAVIAQVEGTAGSLAGQWHGQASASVELCMFPSDFVWGAPAAAYQIEGAAREDGPLDEAAISNQVFDPPVL